MLRIRAYGWVWLGMIWYCLVLSGTVGMLGIVLYLGVWMDHERDDQSDVGAR